MVSRGYAMVGLVLFSILSLAYVYYRPAYLPTNMTPYKAPTESLKIRTTWEEFLKDCGGEVIVENFVHARSVFNVKYENNIVSWTGYFADSKQPNNVVPLFGSDHALNLLVKMMPSESILYPDLVLSVSSTLLREQRNVIKALKKGDEIRF